MSEGNYSLGLETPGTLVLKWWQVLCTIGGVVLAIMGWVAWIHWTVLDQQAYLNDQRPAWEAMKSNVLLMQERVGNQGQALADTRTAMLNGNVEMARQLGNLTEIMQAIKVDLAGVKVNLENVIRQIQGKLEETRMPPRQAIPRPQ